MFTVISYPTHNGVKTTNSFLVFNDKESYGFISKVNSIDTELTKEMKILMFKHQQGVNIKKQGFSVRISSIETFNTLAFKTMLEKLQDRDSVSCNCVVRVGNTKFSLSNDYCSSFRYMFNENECIYFNMEVNTNKKVSTLKSIFA